MPCQPLGFSLHLRDTTVIMVGVVDGIIADRPHTGVSE
jgi:hypothetical protein